MSKTSIIIATYNRPQELENCIKSIISQKKTPDEIVIVDDGELIECPFYAEVITLGIEYDYIKKDNPGLTASRNRGIEVVTGDIVIFLDDDIVLDKEFINELLKVYDSDKNKEVGGVGGFVANRKKLKTKNYIRKIYDSIFLISGFSEGRSLPSGFFTEYGSTWTLTTKVKEVEFLSGCVMSFRREVFHDFLFDTDVYVKHSIGEDKDFSYRVSKQYKLLLNPMAKVLHLESPKMRLDSQNECRMIITNMHRFIKRHFKRGWWTWLLFYYAIFGSILFTISALVITRKRSCLEQLKGYIYAIKDNIKDS